MNPSPARSLLSRLTEAVLSIPLRFKITVPYLVVAILLAGLATWLVSQAFGRTLQERFRGQLVDNFAVAGDTVFQVETDQLAAERAIAHTTGVPEAIAAGDAEALDRLVRPIAANARLAFAHLLDASGRAVYSLIDDNGQYILGQVADFKSWEPARRVRAGDSDRFGDKFVGIVDAPWGTALYTAGPVKEGERLIGVVLVGTPLTRLVQEMSGTSLANVTLYRPDGAPAASTFAGNETAPALTPDLIQTLATQGTHQLQNRIVRFGSREYGEAVGLLILRGQPSGWLTGVALPRSLITENRELSPAELAGWFTVGVLAVIGLGVVIAQLIAVPVFELLRASRQVAQGRLDVRVGVRSQDEIGVLASGFNRMVDELRQREFMRDLFGRVVSEEVREALLTGQLGLGGELKTISVLFSDIRGFTSFSEALDPAEVVAFLNSYFAVMTRIIRESGGLVNKFGGDSLMAIYGAPVALPASETALRAVRAALTMRSRLAEFNAWRIEAGQQPIRIGVAVNTGEVITGNIGSEERFEYTVIGDTVNVASRVQGLSDQYETNILITEATLQALEHPERFDVIDLGEVSVRGRALPVHVFGVRGMRVLVPPDDWLGHVRSGRRDILEVVYLHCLGFSTATIALVKQLSPAEVNRWVERAAAHYEAASRELREEFGLTDGQLKHLWGHGTEIEPSVVGGSNGSRAGAEARP